MTTTADPDARLAQLPQPVRLAAQGAAASLIFEQLVRGAVRPLLALGFYAGLGLMGATTWLPGWLRVGLLAGLLIWCIFSLWRTARQLEKPSRRARLRRLEQASHIPAGSLLLHLDTPIDGAIHHPYWQRALAHVPHIRAWAWPRLTHLWADYFPWTPLLLLLLCAAPLVGGQSSWTNMQAAFSPWPTSLEQVQISAVVRPPRYTDLPPQALVLRGGSTTALRAVRGSDVLITLTGVSGKLKFAGVPLQMQADGNSHAGAITLRKNGSYKVKNGFRTLATLEVRLREDGAPELVFLGPPKITGNQSLDVRYRIADDYGVKSVVLVATDGRKADAQLLPTVPGAQGTAQSWRDFTPSRFAGKSVQLFLVGFDAQGNRGISAPLHFNLPERRFTHPVAQQIIGVRKLLFQSFPNFRSIAAGLDVISRRPDSFNGKLSVFAALRMIKYRLERPEAYREIESSAGMLWHAALDLEGANNSTDALRAAFEQAQRAIRAGQNVNAAMAELQRQMANYMAQAAQTQQLDPNSEAQSISRDDIARMMQEMQARAEAGDTAGAQAMLQQMQQLMENLQQASAGSAPAQAAQQALQRLRGLAAQQQGVMNETAATNITSAIVGADQLQQDLQNLARDQQMLSRQLRAQSGQMPQNASKSLGEAGAAMQAAASQLRSGASRQALLAQGRAMNGLRDAMAQLQQQAEGKGNAGRKRALFDPLGRFNGGNLGPEYKLPTGADRQQVQEIRRLLQERAADPARSAAERAYILRLLKQF